MAPSCAPAIEEASSLHAGLTRFQRRFIIALLLNGDIRLMSYLAKHGRLPWDAILGAEIAQAYKLCPDAYLRIHRHPLAFAP
jgi:hypothetical protein